MKHRTALAAVALAAALLTAPALAQVIPPAAIFRDRRGYRVGAA